MPDADPTLPVDALRERFAAERDVPVVLSSPTGSGKSTRVPTWCEGRVIVVEPRRVACRALATRVAELEGATLGREVGYVVRDERRAGDDTRLTFVTPGVALRTFERLLESDAVIVDELHERRLDVDLLLALLQGRYDGRLVTMSATVDGDRVAAHLGGVHLSAEGRLYPVDIRHHPEGALLPDPRGIDRRVLSALERAADDPGDVLVFLPGKGEIHQVADALSSRRDLTVVALHGGLSLREQSRAFAPAKKRKVVLATNVAETSVTVPGVGVVIDTGLVRRTRYHQGRGYLSLLPIALDAADQRAGRAGRTSAGVCYRLWDGAAQLEARTPPEIRRESLVPLILGAAACGARVEELPFLDAPEPHALEEAREELSALSALGEDGRLTEAGRALHGLPLDAGLGRLLIEAKGDPAVDDAVDLVAALATGRPIFTGPPPEVAAPDAEELREEGCDAVGLVRALRSGDPREHPVSGLALREARDNARRLRRALGLPDEAPLERAGRKVDRRTLARLALAADPRSGHVVRRRKRHLALANGGTELALGRESAAGVRDDLEAAVVLASRAIATGPRDTRLFATAVMPVPLAWLRDAGLGRERVAEVRLEKGRVVARIERVHAKKVIGERDESPRGALLRDAVAELYLRGSYLPAAARETRTRLASRRLAAQLAQSQVGRALALPDLPEPPSPEDWVRDRLATLGLEEPEDLALLGPDDLVADDVPYEVRSLLDKEFPRELDLGGATYRVEYDLDRRRVLLHIAKGDRKTPPPRSWLPRFEGFRVFVEAGRRLHAVR